MIIPVYNEHEVLKRFHSRLNSALVCIHKPIEILYIDDGSQDVSGEIIIQFKKRDSRISYLALSRNFGKEIALTAGLNYAQGEFVIIMDADLQHPPELIPKLIQVAQQGYDIVYARPIKGITSFTIMPLKLASYLGLITAFIAFLYGIIISKTILFGDSARGYPSLMVVVLFLGSIQLFSLGIIGEYLGRTFNETENRPLYFIKNYFPNNFDV